MKKIHLWQDELIDTEELNKRLPSLGKITHESLNLTLSSDILMNAAEKFYEKIKRGEYTELVDLIEDLNYTRERSQSMFDAIAELLKRENILKRLKSDLGSYTPFELRKPDYSKPVFEAWQPLGVQVHVVPGNAVSVAPFSMMEGLMAQNINILKNTSRNGIFAQKFIKALVDCDDTGVLKHFVYIFEFSSSEEEKMKSLVNLADVVNVCGGEEAVKSIQAITPTGVRFVQWGHKISFGYFTQSVIKNQEYIEQLAREICEKDQQSCTSPQCVLVESKSNEELNDFAQDLFNALEKVSPEYFPKTASIQESAEITAVTHLQEIEAAYGNGKVLKSDDNSFRVLVDYRSGLQPSPLFRTIWVKPIQSNKIIEVLKPFSAYLQTCGLACGNIEELNSHSRLLLKAGIQRITKIGSQHKSYVGEPHDSVYALQQYTKRIDIQADEKVVGNLPSLYYANEEYEKIKNLQEYPIMSKDMRNELKAPIENVYLKSGGSSGNTKVSGYSWQDWELFTKYCADACAMCGVGEEDRCAILYSAGNLYGGFILMFDSLRQINTTVLPIASHLDTLTTAKLIVEMKANLVMGMPSYLRKLFREQKEILQSYGGVKKMMYGGEMMTEEQKQWFREEYGVEDIFSPIYASNDALLNGYGSNYCKNGEFHVPTNFIDFEIVKLDEDKPVEKDEVGRVLISLKSITKTPLYRYEIGDLAKWVTGNSPDEHKTPMFKLMGRHGDIVRCGAKFINYREIITSINKSVGYTDDVQMIISTSKDGADVIDLKLMKHVEGKEETIIDALKQDIADLNYSLSTKNLTLHILPVEAAEFEVAASSGKTRQIIDNRN